MPGHGTIRLRNSGAAAPTPATPPTPAPLPPGTSVGHGTIRLIARPVAYTASRTPSAPPPTQETAKAYGHGKITLRT